MLNYDIADKPISMTRSLILNAYKVSMLTFCSWYVHILNIMSHPVFPYVNGILKWYIKIRNLLQRC